LISIILMILLWHSCQSLSLSLYEIKIAFSIYWILC
jgi:hypothetical protein